MPKCEIELLPILLASSTGPSSILILTLHDSPFQPFRANLTTIPLLLPVTSGLACRLCTEYSSAFHLLDGYLFTTLTLVALYTLVQYFTLFLFILRR